MEQGTLFYLKKRQRLEGKNEHHFVQQQNVFLLSYPLNHLMTFQVYLVTTCEGPDTQVGNHVYIM